MTSESHLDALLAQLTLAEKLSLLAGADFWTTSPVERLGIPAVKLTDGPNGARGARPAEPDLRLTSACFPCGIALAATWDTDLIQEIGVALAEETKSKGASVLLAPTVNIHRSPLNGRNFECYSEDPYLTSRIAVAYIQGLQSQGVAACIKHYVGNDSEFERHSISSEIAPRPLHEIYLPPFKAAVQEAGVWAIMSAYNRVNGTYVSESPALLRDLLKEAWGFDGVVISDWYGTYSDNVAAGGLDLEMPGPARHMGPSLLALVEQGTLAVADIDDKVRRLLRLFDRVGALERAAAGQLAPPPEQAIDRSEHRQLLRRAAGQAAVLLKNDGDALPLDTDQVRRIAVIGVNAVWAPIMGGGSAYVTPHYVVNPLDAISRRAGDQATVRYAIGCGIHKLLPPITPDWLTSDDGRQGLTATFYNQFEPGGDGQPGDAVHQEIVAATSLAWFGSHPPDVDPRCFSLRLSGWLTAPAAGNYTFGLMAAGKSRLRIDGQTVVDNWQPYTPTGRFFDMGREELLVDVPLPGGRPVAIEVEYSAEGATGGQALRLGCLPKLADDAIEQAARLAAESDVALLFAGTNGDWESEGRDREDMALPGRQAELIAAVAAANPNTIVILNTGSPVEMPWLGQVKGVVQAWFPGQESGHAIADLLFGDINPSGRLPQTFPVRLEDNPAYINYPGENGRVHYGEGLFVGYRYYDQKRIAPLFPFGHGLSYSRFGYSDLRLAAEQLPAGEPVQLSLAVTNEGERAGAELVQLYVRHRGARLMRPEKELKAFARVELAPGETRTVTFSLGDDAFAYYDDAPGQWVVEPGQHELLIGRSAGDIRLRASVELVGDGQVGAGELDLSAPLHAGLPLALLLSDEGSQAILADHFGDMIDNPQLQMVLNLSLLQIHELAPQLLTADKLRTINAELAQLTEPDTPA